MHVPEKLPFTQINDGIDEQSARDLVSGIPFKICYIKFSRDYFNDF